jgi:hypothetical protein
MPRIHLFEFTDQSWYLQVFRRMQTDYLQFVISRRAGHQNLISLFAKALRHSGTLQIVDLCSGGAGPWVQLSTQLQQAGLPVRVGLTDKFPSPQGIAAKLGDAPDPINYQSTPVDALEVPADLPGMRTLFEGFHHFKPAEARQLLQDAFEKGVAIGVFEASLPMPLGPLIFLLSPLMTLLGYLFATPFICPAFLGRFLWTYLLPIVPLATCWDGLVSFLRVYSPGELKKLVGHLVSEGYRWEIGQASTGTPLFVFTYLLGYPVQSLNLL